MLYVKCFYTSRKPSVSDYEIVSVGSRYIVNSKFNYDHSLKSYNDVLKIKCGLSETYMILRCLGPRSYDYGDFVFYKVDE